MNYQKTTADLPDIYDIWDYSNPDETRKRFNELASQAKESDDVSYQLQLQTQIARTYSLEGKFDSAHAILDEVKPQLTENLPLVRIRYLLERGRTFNSDGDKTTALTFFTDAYTLSSEDHQDFFAVDAAHMIAIATPESANKEKWNLIGVEIAEKSKDKQAHNWLGSLYNNIGWDYFDKERYPEALAKFEEALVFQKERGKEKNDNTIRINIARWCVAKGYRFVGQIDDALSMQEALLSEHEQGGTSDGYVFEELGELYLLKNNTAQSKKYFAEAFKGLSKDSWLVKNESERLKRLKKLGALENGSSK